MQRMFIYIFVFLLLLTNQLLADYKAALEKGDYAAALAEILPLAKIGDAKAQFELGGMYSAGHGVPQSNTEAIKWLTRSAERGNVDAQYSLGTQYNYGWLIKENKEEAVKWYKKAAEQGHIEAQNKLGEIYSLGLGVQKDTKEAAKWYQKAAIQGHPDAQYSLGLMYLSGEGTNKDDVEGSKWIKAAAEQGHGYAQEMIGFIYYYGWGVQQDYKEAAKWYRMAADQGYAYAQAALGANYVLGQGVPKDYVEAYMWLNLSAAEGNTEASKLRDLISKKMTLDQIAEAQKLSSVWINNKSQKEADNYSIPSEITSLPILTIGSGFAVSSDGFIVTANHVVAGAISIRVHQGIKTLNAKLITSDSINDIAILKVDKPTPDYLPIAPMRSATAGDRVFTVGYPMSDLLGQEPKYTEGVISSQSGIQDSASFLQITVPIQPGNSGGPLVNEKGQVVGIISSTASLLPFMKESGTAPQNLNWAIKADYIRPLLNLPETVQKKYISRKDVIEKTRQATYMIEVKSRAK